jgi:hypothetical protein
LIRNAGADSFNRASRFASSHAAARSAAGASLDSRVRAGV